MLINPRVKQMTDGWLRLCQIDLPRLPCFSSNGRRSFRTLRFNLSLPLRAICCHLFTSRVNKYLLLLLSCQLCFAEIHVIYTSALLPEKFELRKEEYLASLAQLRSYGLEPWIIEATNIHSSFFDELSTQVLYPQRHIENLRNKGVNETLSMRACIPYLPFNDDDIVIKMTGRYLLHHRDFIDTIKATADRYDVWGVYGKHFTKEPDLFTGCFAMRWKYLKKIIEEMNLDQAERDYIAVEILFGNFTRDPNLRVNKLRNLNVRARIFICEDNYYEF